MKLSVPVCSQKCPGLHKILAMKNDKISHEKSHWHSSIHSTKKLQWKGVSFTLLFYCLLSMSPSGEFVESPGLWPFSFNFFFSQVKTIKVKEF